MYFEDGILGDTFSLRNSFSMRKDFLEDDKNTKTHILYFLKMIQHVNG